MRILAPTLVLALAVLLVARWAADPAREAQRSWIAASWDTAAERPEIRARLLERLEDHLRRYGDDAEDRWFVARAYLKVGEARRSIDVVWGDEGLASAPGTARRFGALWLRVLGFLDDQRLRRPRPAATLSALLLDEGGDAQARAWIDALAERHAEVGLLETFYGAFLYGTRDTAVHLASRLRARPEETARVVAALLALGPDPYPGRADDLALLQAKVEDASMRNLERVVWSTACVVLGRSEEPRALDQLTSLRRRLALSPEEMDERAADIAAAGLLAGGRWDMLEPLAPYLGEQGPLSLVRAWYVDALLVRLARGDPEAPEALVPMWDSLQQHPDPQLLERLATGLLLRDELPPEGVPLDRLLADLESPAATTTMHAIAAAWRLRSGEREARGRLLGILGRLAAERRIDPDPTLANPVVVSPVRTVLRALYLYDPTLPHETSSLH